jgi:Taurine catabolism dioxygenase TauD, TfdA family
MGADILCLHVRTVAEHGGATFVASSWTIYKELMMSYPEVAELLSQPVWPIQTLVQPRKYFDRSRDVSYLIFLSRISADHILPTSSSGNPPRHILAPLLQVNKDNKIMVSLDPGRLGLHPATARSGLEPSIPDLTSNQLQALAILSDLASKYRLRLDTKPGDMVFINNWALLHARDSYTDSKSGPRRHLVRLWLRNTTLGWDVPKPMRVPWEAAFGPGGNGYPALIPGPMGGLRGAVSKKYPVVPALEYKAPKYTAGSAAFILEDGEDVNGHDMAHDVEI